MSPILESIQICEQKIEVLKKAKEKASKQIDEWEAQKNYFERI
jgi:hypothetical protein